MGRSKKVRISTARLETRVVRTLNVLSRIDVMVRPARGLWNSLDACFYNDLAIVLHGVVP